MSTTLQKLTWIPTRICARLVEICFPGMLFSENSLHCISVASPSCSGHKFLLRLLCRFQELPPRNTCISEGRRSHVPPYSPLTFDGQCHAFPEEGMDGATEGTFGAHTSECSLFISRALLCSDNFCLPPFIESPFEAAELEFLCLPVLPAHRILS